MTICSLLACTVNWYWCRASLLRGSVHAAFQVSWPTMGFADSVTVQSMPRSFIASFQVGAVSWSICLRLTQTAAVPGAWA